MATKANNERWSPVFQQLLEEEAAKVPADPETGEVADAGGIPQAIIRMAAKAGMTVEDLNNYISAEYEKSWNELPGTAKSNITQHLYELGQAGE
jgi:hypothetical protein